MDDDLGYDHEIITRTGDYENITTHFHGTIEEAVTTARNIQSLVHGGSGISETDFRVCLDSMLAGLSVRNGIELWEKMNKEQKLILQEVKKALKRKAYKNGTGSFDSDKPGKNI